MEVSYQSLIHLVFIGIITLFPVVNPIGTAFILNPYFDNLTRKERRNAVKKIALYAFIICTFTLIAGHWILELFGISIPVIQLAGGIMICKMGWEALSAGSNASERQIKAAHTAEAFAFTRLQDKLFYPITFPVTAGAGTISVLFTLGARSTHEDTRSFLLNTGALIISISFICLLIFIFYLNTKTLIQYMGPKGENVVNRISAFLIFCVGLQIAVNGIKALMVN
ncbi:MAG: NAAT family transporter [Bacteroidetes bacterium]|nr:NAAT family transporter [Bacteroidota bacterium]